MSQMADTATRGKKGRGVRGFSMLEALVALAIAAIVITSSAALFLHSIRSSADPGRRFSALTIAEQRMELLASVPANSPLLTNSEAGVITDPDPSAGVDGPAAANRRVNERGEPDASGMFEVYWKIENPVGTLRHIAVYCRYNSSEGASHVVLETYR